MAENKQISISSLCKSLVEEFTYSLAIIKRSHPATRVNSVKFRLGQSEEQLNTTERSAILLRDRYPQSSKGWEIELDLGENSQITFQGNQQKSVDFEAPHLLDLVADFPLHCIDGVNKIWQNKLADHNLLLIKDLSRLQNDEVHSLAQDCRSLKVREFYQKVQLLKHPLPVIPRLSDDKDISVISWLKMSAADIQACFAKNVITDSDVGDIVAALDLLNLALDNATLQKMTVEQLRSGY